MKIIFLDVDGVLNSLPFHERTGGKTQIDPYNVAMLKALVNASGAKLVLTSSWRYGWSRREEKCGDEGRLLNEALGRYGLQIMDKTGDASGPLLETRCREILTWLKKAPEEVESFVILDDGDYEWEKYGLDRYLVQTSFAESGFGVKHLPKAMEILKHG